MRFATITVIILGVAAAVVLIAARYADTYTAVFMAAGLGLVMFFGSMPVLLGALARRKKDR